MGQKRPIKSQQAVGKGEPLNRVSVTASPSPHSFRLHNGRDAPVRALRPEQIQLTTIELANQPH